MGLLIFLMHKNKFIHSFFSSFPVCLLATCSLLSASTYIRRTYYLLVCIFLQTCEGIMEIATGPEQCNANLTKGQEISEAIFFLFNSPKTQGSKDFCSFTHLEPRAVILENFSFPFGMGLEHFGVIAGLFRQIGGHS